MIGLTQKERFLFLVGLCMMAISCQVSDNVLLSPPPAKHGAMKKRESAGKASLPEPVTAGRATVSGARGYLYDMSTDPRLQKRISLTVKDAELQDVIRMLARHAGLNIIMNPDQVRGRVTFELHDVPVGAALKAILRTNGLELIHDPETYRVESRRQVGYRGGGPETVVARVPLNWMKAERALLPITAPMS